MHSSLSELILIVLVALLVINPKRLPETFRALGRLVRFLQKKMAEFKQTWFDEPL